MMGTVLQVALGGALGASARYGLGLWVGRIAGPGMPLGVLTANVLGSLAMGIFIATAGRFGIGWLTPFLAVGLLGGFTTFSSFSLEAVRLMEGGEAGTALLYVTLSVGVGIGGLYLGLLIGRVLP